MTYGYIDTDKVRELASQGLNANKIGVILGHSKTATINSKNIKLLFRHKMQSIQTIKSVLGFGEGFLMFMRQNKYKQQAFDRYLYTRGIK